MFYFFSRELIQFAMDNDDIVKNIAENGRNFIWDKLRFTEVVCYWTRLIKKYSKLMRYKPTLEQDMMKIHQMDRYLFGGIYSTI